MQPAQRSGRPAEKASRVRGDDQPVLPAATTDDTEAGWGELPADNDAWLLAQRPPHWE